MSLSLPVIRSSVEESQQTLKIISYSEKCWKLNKVKDKELMCLGLEVEGRYVFLFFFKFLLLLLFFFFWLHWVFVAMRRLSLAAASGGYSSLWCTGFSLPWLLLLLSTGSRHAGFSSCGSRDQ